MRRIALAALAAAFGLVAPGLPAERAEGVTITGARTVTAPARIRNGSFNQGEVLVFAEAAGFTLTEALTLDGGTVLAKGTVVDVFYVVFDPASQTKKMGAVTFDVDILGIAATGRSLRSTDFLGKTGTDYGRFSHRGFESIPGTSRRDSISISTSGFAVNYNVRANDPGDAVRVIVAHVPEPGTALMLAAGCGGLALLSRRRAA
jgi:hypothetical protein